MKRRNVLIAAGGAIGTATGGTAVAHAARADLLADGELTRGNGEPATIERTITRDSVEYREPSNVVREHGHARPFKKWARSECEEIGAGTVVSVVANRLDTSLEGVGSGVRALLFGPVITVDHTVTRDPDGSIVSEPNVPFDQLISVAPRTLTVSVTLEGQRFTKAIPVGARTGTVYRD